MATMKELIVDTSGTQGNIVDTPIPKPEAKQVVIKVVVSGTNPKDWKYPHFMSAAANSGDDIAGIVHEIGADVYEFKVGDRVAAFHEMGTPGGSFAEYAVAWDYTTFHIPNHLSFEEAATIPLAAMTSALGLFVDMKLPAPWSPQKPSESEKLPVLIYGASSATGAFAAQLAKLSNLHPIIGVAGNSAELAKSLCDYVIDYRDGEDAVVKGIQDALRNEGLGDKLKHAYDGISEKGSHEIIARVIDPNGGYVSHLLPPAQFARTKDFAYPDGVTMCRTYVGQAHNKQKDFAFVGFRYLARAAEDGRFKGHPYEVLPGGLEGVKKGLENLKEGKASGKKYVYHIAETPGL